MDLYKDSWALYREHTASFIDDIDYYLRFSKSHTTLEMFAGYGRITNHLVRYGVDIQTIELSPDFSQYIDLPNSKKHIGDVTTLTLDQKFQRIIAGYNSFCLLTSDEQLRRFFLNINTMLCKDGLASLSYYHPDAWESAKGHEFLFRNAKVEYIPSFDLSQRNNKKGIWVDRYVQLEKEIQFKYPVRIFESFDDIAPFLNGTELRLHEVIENYHNKAISEAGWIEYVIKKVG